MIPNRRLLLLTSFIFLSLAVLRGVGAVNLTPCANVTGNLFSASSCQPSPSFWYWAFPLPLPAPYGLVSGENQFASAISLGMTSYNFSMVSLQSPLLDNESKTYVLEFTLSTYGGSSGLGAYWGIDGISFPNFIGSLVDLSYSNGYAQYLLPFEVVGPLSSFYVGIVGFSDTFNYGAALLPANSTQVFRPPYRPYARATAGLASINVVYGSTDLFAEIDYIVVTVTARGGVSSSSTLNFTSTTTPLSFIVDGLNPGQYYDLSVAAHNSFGLSDSNIIYSVVPMALPSAITYLQYSADLRPGFGILHFPSLSWADSGYSYQLSYIVNITGSDGSDHSFEANSAFEELSVSGLTDGVLYTAVITLVNPVGQSVNSTSVTFTHLSLPSFPELPQTNPQYWFSATASQLQLNDHSVNSWQPWYYSAYDAPIMSFQQSSPAFNTYLPVVDSADSPTFLSFNGNSFLPFITQPSYYSTGYVNEIIGVWNYAPNAALHNCLGFFLGGLRLFGNALNNTIGDPSSPLGTSAVYLNGTGIGTASNTHFFSHPTVVTIRLNTDFSLSGSGGYTLGASPNIAAGSFPSNGSNAFCGSVSEFIGLETYSGSDGPRRAVENYLGAKHNIPIYHPNCTALNDCGSNGVCAADNTCVCVNHHAGAACSDCAPGYYKVGSFDPSCYVCPDCGAHGHCNQDNGQCICDPRWTGYNCGHCSTGYFGADCSSGPGVTRVNAPYPLYDVGGQTITVIGNNFLANPSVYLGICIFIGPNFSAEEIAYPVTNTSFQCSTPQLNAGISYTFQVALETSSGDRITVDMGAGTYILFVTAKCPAEDVLGVCGFNGYCKLGNCICYITNAWGRVCNNTQVVHPYNNVVSVSQVGVGSVSAFLFDAVQTAQPLVAYLWQVEGLPTGVTGRFQKILSIGSDRTVFEIEVSPAAQKGSYTLTVLTVSPTFTASTSVILRIGFGN